MYFLLIAWFVVAACFAGIPALYFMMMKKQSLKPWALNIDENYRPSAAILVPVHNEEKTIRLKLENLSRVQYPSEKVETVIVNDASQDKTMAEISKNMADKPSLRIKTFDSNEQRVRVKSISIQWLLTVLS